jgi:hypothetical protein
MDVVTFQLALLYASLLLFTFSAAEEDCWLKGADPKDAEALDIWLAKRKINFMNGNIKAQLIKFAAFETVRIPGGQF